MMSSENEETATQQYRPSAIRLTTVGSERSGPSCRWGTRRLSSHCGHLARMWSAGVLDAPAAAVALRRLLPPYATQIISETPTPVIICVRRKVSLPYVRRTHSARMGRSAPTDASLPMFGEREQSIHLLPLRRQA